uniref:Uncharacterized protein n=1 Tax=Anguilla anguilla TaxID=7936 RepID=A0A0E9SBM8_ANGAN
MVYRGLTRAIQLLSCVIVLVTVKVILPSNLGLIFLNG